VLKAQPEATRILVQCLLLEKNTRLVSEEQHNSRTGITIFLFRRCL